MTGDLGGLDIQTYLAQHQQKDLLRFLTCGNVDDGKSTLIGRLLHDSKMIYDDQLAAIRADSTRFNTTGGDEIDLALLVDGLQAEREQGITIDVAYRYFSTDKRKFIIADTPGHEQYTRNMATGASTADLAVILIDARNGVQVQTRRHSFIVSLLGIPRVVVAINKMDAVGFSEEVFDRIRADYERFAAALTFEEVTFLPLSALRGDNVVHPSRQMPWYNGPTLLYHLEHVPVARAQSAAGFRFPVQWINRPNLDFRGYCGTIAAGHVKVGDELLALPSRTRNRVRSILTVDGEHPEAHAGQAVTLTLEHETDISRGDMLVHPERAPLVESQVEAMLVWMSEQPLQLGRPYFIKHTTRLARGAFSSIAHRVDVNTLAQEPAERLALNEIGRVTLSLAEPLAFDPYHEDRSTGAFVVIDRASNNTVAAGMLLGKAAGAAQRHAQPAAVFALGPSYVHIEEEQAVPFAVGPEFWQKLEQGGAGDSMAARVASGGWLLSSFLVDQDMTNWELHPDGDEILYLTAGELEVVFDEEQGARGLSLRGGEACLVPRGVWHRFLCRTPGTLVAFTFGRNTQHRPA